jgi:hypothetical protein
MNSRGRIPPSLRRLGRLSRAISLPPPHIPRGECLFPSSDCLFPRGEWAFPPGECDPGGGEWPIPRLWICGWRLRVPFPMGKTPFLVGKASFPVGNAPFPLEKAPFPAGSAAVPLGKTAREAPAGSRSPLPVRARGAPVGEIGFPRTPPGGFTAPGMGSMICTSSGKNQSLNPLAGCRPGGRRRGGNWRRRISGAAESGLRIARRALRQPAYPGNRGRLLAGPLLPWRRQRRSAMPVCLAPRRQLWMTPSRRSRSRRLCNAFYRFDAARQSV